MKVENKTVATEKVVTISHDELTGIMAEVAAEMTSKDNCPATMILVFGIFSANVLAKIFNNKGEN